LAETKTGLEGVVKYRLIAGTASVATGSTLSYVTGADYSWDSDKKDVFNRATFAHYKSGRGKGKFSAKTLYVNQTDADAFRAAVANVSFPHAYIELQIDGIAGTGEKVLCFANSGLDTLSLSQPDDDLDSQELAFTFCTAPEEKAYADRRIT
jgi:hypothetical protein